MGPKESGSRRFRFHEDEIEKKESYSSIKPDESMPIGIAVQAGTKNAFDGYTHLLKAKWGVLAAWEPQ